MLEGSDFPLSDNPTLAELARELLLYRMQEYSEAMCASWLSDAEFDVWELGEAGPGKPPGAAWLRRNGLDCRKLGELSGGWWVYDSDGQNEGDGLRFIPLVEWVERYAIWREKRLAQSRERAQEAAGKGLDAEVAARWDAVPMADRAALLEKVWCVHCRQVQPLIVTGGHCAFLGGGLWLTGSCPGCGGLLQTEYRAQATDTPHHG